MVVDGVFVPALVSERESDGSWEDCTWASGVMLANAGTGADWYPATRAEYEALRVAGGDGPAEKPHDGSNLVQLAAGMSARYGWSGARFDGWPAVERQPAGTALVVQGYYRTLPTHFRRWDAGFTGAHAAAVVRTPLGWWWLDPLAVPGYPGEPISATQLASFVRSIGGALAVTIGKEARMDIAMKVERWVLDGGPAKVTTLGAPRIAGVVDWKKRLAFLSGLAGAAPRLELIERARLSAPVDVLDDEFRAALSAYELADPIAAAAAAKYARIAAIVEGP